MRAAVLYGAHDFRIEEVDAPEMKNDEYRIAVKYCGVCHSELPQWKNTLPGLEYPRRIGHEVCGEIIEAGSDVSKFKVKDKVAVWTDWGGFAEEVVVKEDRLCRIANSVAMEEALSEPIACVTNAVRRTNIQLADTVAVIGTGFMGLILIQQIKQCAVQKVIAIDVREEVLKIASSLGADIVINPARDNIKQRINDITNNTGVDIVFEVGGVQETIDLSADILRMEGKLVLFGYHPGERIIKDLGWWNWMAFDIINAHFRDINTILGGMQIGMKMLNSGKIDMKPLITDQFNLNNIEEAFNTAAQKPAGFIKAVIKI